jgi:hypothetical protein
MKPSAAMLAGSLLCKPWKLGLFGTDKQGADCGCALGAMLVGYAGAYRTAKGYQPLLDKVSFLKDITLIPDLKTLDKMDAEAVKATWQAKHKCPAKDCNIDGSAEYVCSTLNDYHDWTREAIAGWLAGLGL